MFGRIWKIRASETWPRLQLFPKLPVPWVEPIDISNAVLFLA